MARAKKLKLILEKKGRKWWGRVLVNDNLVVDSASTLQALEKKLKKALKDFEGVTDTQFEHIYDLPINQRG